MNDFLRTARSALDGGQNVAIVIGNESCDLDSAVCAIVLAHFYTLSSSSDSTFVPVLNIMRENLPLKTEVTYLLRKHGIDVDLLICA